ncbi:hypothetical protein [Limosilactobacillus reuteri]|uniref:Uncharacterized protein n=1 Tax=Limosilactobacillus reuteri subsp. rodentium (strain DSM 17509 / CIP 109821 / 100-23) TaxID=349123 RepID=B3XNY9_LIMR1|nr:hypothetical protein [Limosilactobacillus reuteri]EDX43525.1 hypothetical protein Lreu23DRAFT_5047 [Limosilactobacillus reuteri subsp. rodentium]MCC4475765.1 hypothetical protein [Limosilactobacillus reuteri]
MAENSESYITLAGLKGNVQKELQNSPLLITDIVTIDDDKHPELGARVSVQALEGKLAHSRHDRITVKISKANAQKISIGDRVRLRVISSSVFAFNNPNSNSNFSTVHVSILGSFSKMEDEK